MQPRRYGPARPKRKNRLVMHLGLGLAGDALNRESLWRLSLSRQGCTIGQEPWPGNLQ